VEPARWHRHFHTTREDRFGDKAAVWIRNLAVAAAICRSSSSIFAIIGCVSSTSPLADYDERKP
jgi:hypothetical protein